MLGLGPLEILLVVAIAIIFIGPKQLPKIATTFGHWYRKITETMETVKKDFNTEIYSKPPPTEAPKPTPPSSEIESTKEDTKDTNEGNNTDIH